MAIQPIDLSTVYSQMDKMGQFNATQVQNAHMASRAHLEKTAQQDSEKARTVQEASKNKDSNSIKADVNQGGDLLDRVVMIRRQIALELGTIVPIIRLRDNIQLNPNQYVIKIKGIQVSEGEILFDHYLFRQEFVL